MSDLLQPRRNRRTPLVIGGSLVFAALAILVTLDAVRGVHPSAAEGVLSLREATLYRICAAAACTAVSVWIFVAGGPRREDGPSLLR